MNFWVPQSFSGKLLWKYFEFYVKELKFRLFSARFDADQLNKLKNMVSKVIGEKMKVCIISYSTQSPNTNCQLWFGSYMVTKYFWVVFNSDLFLLPMHNLVGHIVKFTFYKKCCKWGLWFFVINFIFSEIIYFLPIFL